LAAIYLAASSTLFELVGGLKNKSAISKENVLKKIENDVQQFITRRI
jgi:hypothetical protein